MSSSWESTTRRQLGPFHREDADGVLVLFGRAPEAPEKGGGVWRFFSFCWGGMLEWCFEWVSQAFGQEFREVLFPLWKNGVDSG